MQVAKLAMDKAANAVREARGSTLKRLQNAQKKKTATPDEVYKAREKMEKITDRAQSDVKLAFESSKKTLERV